MFYIYLYIFRAGEQPSKKALKKQQKAAEKEAKKEARKQTQDEQQVKIIFDRRNMVCTLERHTVF